MWRRLPRGLLEAASLFGRLAGNAGAEYRGVNRGNAESGTVAVVGEAEVDRAGAPCSAAIRLFGAAVLKGEDAPRGCRCVIRAWRMGRGFVPVAKLPAPAVQEL